MNKYNRTFYLEYENVIFLMRTCLNINLNIQSDGQYKCICLEMRNYYCNSRE